MIRKQAMIRAWLAYPFTGEFPGDYFWPIQEPVSLESRAEQCCQTFIYVNIIVAKVAPNLKMTLGHCNFQIVSKKYDVQ